MYHDFNTYFGAYFQYGFKCIFAHKGWIEDADKGTDFVKDLEYCGFGYLWILGYVLSLFVL